MDVLVESENGKGGGAKKAWWDKKCVAFDGKIVQLCIFTVYF